MPLSFFLSAEAKSYLGNLAQKSIASALAGEFAKPVAPGTEAESALERKLGSFVTLSHGRNLRGCIGTIIAHEPLWRNVWNMAKASAFEDPRFPPLSPLEWPQISMEISVLDEPSLCPDPELVEVGRHGLILQYQGRSGVFLPQVPIEQGWDRQEYLEHLCAKAGLPKGSWLRPEARLYWYEALVFPARGSE